MSKKGKHKRYSLPKGLHPFEQEFFENTSADLEIPEDQSNFFDYKNMLANYKEAPNLQPLSLVDLDFSDLDKGDFKENLKTLSARVAAQDSINEKIRKATPRNPFTKKGVHPEKKSSASAAEPTHSLEIPGDREVIIEGQSDKSTAAPITPGTLADVSGDDFAQGLTNFAKGGSDFKNELANYDRTNGEDAQAMNDILGVSPESSHAIQVPQDRPVIIEGVNASASQPAPYDPTGPVSGEDEQMQGNLSIVTPPGALGADQVGIGTENPLINEALGIGRPSSHKIIVPQEREVIIEGVSKFILGEDNEMKSCQYYKGKKLNHMTLIFNNDSALDFTTELFNPSVPLQYLISTRQNIDDKIRVAGGQATYSEILFNLLANPLMIICCQIVVTTPDGLSTSIIAQLNQTMFFKNRNVSGLQAAEPLNVAIQRDSMQFQTGIVFFNIPKILNRPFIADGMDTLTYTVLAGNSVVLNFYYKQVQAKRVYYEEAREARNLL